MVSSPAASLDVRIYNSSGYKDLTLCVHQGESGTYGSGDADDVYDIASARNRGESHRWSGECRSSEPQLD